VNAPLLVIPLAIEWIILVTTLAPLLLPKRFDARPQLGIAVWFATFLSAGLASLLAVGIAIWAYSDTLIALNSNAIGDEKWYLALIVSFAPWLALAIGGITLALINIKLEPMFEAAREIVPLLDLGKQPLLNFIGTPVSVVQLPFAYALATNREIIISQFAVDHLSKDELDAVLWHELGHVKSKHFALKKLSRLIGALSSRLAASRSMVAEVERLCEISADNYALKKVTAPTLRLARKLFEI
jgi:Zn-dependent protease with chaperone function